MCASCYYFTVAYFQSKGSRKFVTIYRIYNNILKIPAQNTVLAFISELIPSLKLAGNRLRESNVH